MNMEALKPDIVPVHKMKCNVCGKVDDGIMIKVKGIMPINYVICINCLAERLKRLLD